MGIREWYSYHFPELVKIVNDNYMFAKCVKLLKNRKVNYFIKFSAFEEILRFMLPINFLIRNSIFKTLGNFGKGQ